MPRTVYYDGVKRFVARKSLDFAERFSESKRGSIKSLQMLRKQQREEAEQSFGDCQLPVGQCLELAYIRLVEFCQLEDLDNLLGGLINLFPKLGDPGTNAGKSIHEIKNNARQLFAIRWLPIGTITKDSQTGSPRVRRQFDKLPEEIERIDIALGQILPSIFIVALDVHISAKGQVGFNNLRDKRYLPEIAFNRTLPIGKSLGGYSRSLSQEAMRHEIRNWFNNLRKRVEFLLRPYIRGHFIRFSARTSPRLPAIEVYLFSGASEDSEKLISTWLDKPPHWMWPLGFDLLGNLVFSDQTSVFSFSDNSSDTQNIHQLVVCKEAFAQAQGKGDDQVPINHLLTDTVNELTIGLALLEFLRFTQSNLEQLRHRAFRSVMPDWLSNVRFGPQLRMNGQILTASLLLDRILVEFEQAKPSYLHSTWTNIALKERSGVGREGNREIKQFLVEAIDYRVQTLKRHMELIEGWFAKYVALRNTAAMYWLTVIIVIATIIGVVGLDASRKILESLLHTVVEIIETAIGIIA